MTENQLMNDGAQPGRPVSIPAGPAGRTGERYARAFYDYASDAGTLAADPASIAAIRDVFVRDASFKAFVADRRLSRAQATQGLEAVLQRLEATDAVRRFLGVVARNGRLSILGAILDAVVVLDAKRRGAAVAEVVSAAPLDDAQRAQLVAQLAEAGYGQVHLREQTDSSLIGGFRVRVGAYLIDNTIAGRLSRLQNAMKGAA